VARLIGSIVGVALSVTAGMAVANDATVCLKPSAEACRRLATAGDVTAQLYMAVLLEIGRGVPRNVAEAEAWYRRAAEQGSPFARHRLIALTAAVPRGPPIQPAILRVSHEAPGPLAVTLPLPSASGEPGSAVVTRLSDSSAVTTGLDRLPKWQRVRDWIVEDSDDERDPALVGWARWAEGLQDRPMAARLQAINQRVNDGFRYARDPEIWGERNYWPTPSEVVAKGATDCKGFAIMKLWLARLAGIGDADLQLLVGILPVSRQQHAVLRVAAAGHPVVLDSLRPQVLAGLGVDGFRPILAADLRQVEIFVNGSRGSSSAE
jgi:predicted transglutaminase-like cysteine proteinase